MAHYNSPRFAKAFGLASIAVALAAGTAMPAFAQGGTFKKTGSMNVPRIAHTATGLPNGEVLVAGGDSSSLGGSYLSSTELYNPTSGTWMLTGSMTSARENHQAVLLANGKVLVAGGFNASGGTLASAELFDPSTSTWTATGSMNTARSNFSLTLLTDGEVLAVQGTSAELYNPATGTWTATGGPTSTVGGPNAALLQNGQVLAIGESFDTPSELYDPSSGTWSATGTTDTTMLNPITPVLPSGEVLATGSFASGVVSAGTAALYEPSTGEFLQENGPCSCRGFGGTLLGTGEVLVAGGFITVRHKPHNITETVNSAELWDRSTQTWASTGNLTTSRGGESVNLLSNGQALVAGGETFDKHTNQLVVIANAELFTP